MKILVVSDVYPPHHVGGYELGCSDVVNGLRGRGHDVRVLTSTFQTHPTTDAVAHVECSLQFNFRPTDPPHRKWAEMRIFRAAARRFKPDVVYFWNQRGLTMWFPLVARWCGYKTAFYLSDTAFVAWRVGAWLWHWTNRPQRLVNAFFGKTFLIQGWPVVHGQPCHFASTFLRDVARRNAIPVSEEHSAVIHWGVDESRFTTISEERRTVRRLLYVGQMIAEKGVHTAIAALGLLVQEGSTELTLTLAGGGLSPDYERKLREMPGQLGLTERVHFLGQVPRDALPRIYGQHDVLIFPSEWDEPFAITPLEAMACGLVVVGTTTGGSGEIFRHRETAMTFAAGDAQDCARALQELLGDPQLYAEIRNRGRHLATTRYTLDTMVTSIENSLAAIAGASVPTHGT